jgi:hypothetical protein
VKKKLPPMQKRNCSDPHLIDACYRLTVVNVWSDERHMRCDLVASIGYDAREGGGRREQGWRVILMVWWAITNKREAKR